MKQTQLLPSELIEKRILLIRGQRVMVDGDLAMFYGVATKRLKEQVRRNPGRFPPDFMFELTAKEKGEVVANCDHLGKLKYSPYLPLAFSEHGVLVLANVPNNPRAVEMSGRSHFCSPANDTRYAQSIGPPNNRRDGEEIR